MYLFHRERERELFGPKKRGPKPETFLLKVGELNCDCHELVSPYFSHMFFLTHHLCFPTIESWILWSERMSDYKMSDIQLINRWKCNIVCYLALYLFFYLCFNFRFDATVQTPSWISNTRFQVTMGNKCIAKENAWGLLSVQTLSLPTKLASL